MSMDYWIVDGIGIDVDKIRPHLNKRKVINLILKHYPDNAYALKWRNHRDLTWFDIDDFLYGEPFDNLADVLTYCDDTDTLTYGDANGTAYFYYPTSMPWHLGDNEPKTQAEVRKRIIAAVMAITDLTESEIEELLDDNIYAMGCG